MSSESSLPALTPRSAAAAAAARGIGGGGGGGPSSSGTSPKSAEATIFALSPLQRLEGTAQYRHASSSGGASSLPGNSSQLTPSKEIMAGAVKQISPRGSGPVYSLSSTAGSSGGGGGGSGSGSHGTSPSLGGSGRGSSSTNPIPTPPKSISPARPQLAPLDELGSKSTPSSSSSAPAGSPSSHLLGASSSRTLKGIKNDEQQDAVLKKLDALPRKGNFSAP